MERLRILIAEDESESRLIMSKILQAHYEVTTTKSAPEALMAFQQKEPHIVLTDVHMPGEFDGLELMRKIRNLNDHILIVIITGYGDKATAIEAIRGGAFDLIEKPFRHEELIHIVQRASRYRWLQLENKRQQQDLIAASRLSALGEMSAGIAHEINNPLTVIEGRSILIRKLIKKEKMINETVMYKHLEQIESSVERITKIISGLQSFSRQSDRDPYQPESIHHIVSKALDLCKDKAYTMGVEINSAIEEDVNIDCREAQIGQVLINLLNNAVDAVQELIEKWIDVRVQRRHNRIEIIITDSGNGIPLELRGKLMTPFFTTKPVGQGTGLGLSISKGIVEDHGGSLSIDENCPNTRFIVDLPIYRDTNQRDDNGHYRKDS